MKISAKSRMLGHCEDTGVVKTFPFSYLFFPYYVPMQGGGIRNFTYQDAGREVKALGRMGEGR